MREGGTYRAARRNFVRDLERDGKKPGIKVWKRLDFAQDPPPGVRGARPWAVPFSFE